MDLRRKKGKGQLAPILLLLLIVVLAGGTLAYFLSVPSSGQNLGSSSSGSVVPSVLPVTDPQALDPNGVQIQDPDSFSPNQPGEFVYTLNASPYFSTGTEAGNLLLLNHGSNEYDMQVEFVLKDTGEAIYQSGVIPAGYQVSEGLLSKALEKGSYPATAFLYILDPSNGEILGELEQPIPLYVGVSQ